MSQNITFNGLVYVIPDTGETDWGNNLTDFFVALPQGALQKTGGTFTLTADANFGANFGLVVQYLKSRSSNVSTAGIIRLAVGDSIGWRNNANGGNLLLAVNGSDQLTFNGTAIQPSGNYITALTTDVVAAGPGSVVATIQPNVVSDAKLRQSAALSVMGNATNALANVADITAGTDGFVLVRSGTTLTFGYLVNANIDAAAGIVYSKLNLAGGIVDADINAAAAIALSKLDTTTVSRALVSDPGGLISPATTTSTEIGYVNGVTSSIQTQLDAKIAKTLTTTTGDMIYASGANTPARLPIGSANQVLQTINGVPSWQTVNLSGINYINANPSAEVDTAGWATYADSAANIPVDGTGGTATGLTFSRSTSSPLIGVASFSMAQANSTSLQGKGVSYDFTIDSAYQASALSIQFNFNASSTFVASNGVTAPLNDGTTTTNAGNSDIEVFIYDVTNAVLIPVSPQVIAANGTNNFVYKGIFQTASNSTSYRLIFHVATTSANATGWTFKFDNVSVGPQAIVQGPPVTDMTLTTLTGAWSANTTYTSYLRRVGDRLEGFVKVALTGAPTSATFTLNLPSGLSIDTTKNIDTNSGALGTFAGTSAGGGIAGVVQYSSTTAIRLLYYTGAVSLGLLTQAAPATFANGDYLNIHFSVPIVGWSSTVTMSNDTSASVVAMRYSLATASLSAALSAISYTTRAFDTTASYSGSTFTVPVSGQYQVNAATAVSGTFALNTLTELHIYKNGSTYSRNIAYAGGAITSQYISVSDIVSCVAGDTIQIFCSSGATTPVVFNDSDSKLSISRISGLSAIATTDTVACTYTGSSSTPTFNSLVTVVHNTKVFDTTNSYSTSTGSFTVPVSGKYRVTAALEYGAFVASAINQQYTLQIGKNGSGVLSHNEFTQTTTSVARGIGVSGTISCVAGDTIQIIEFQNLGSTPTIANGISTSISIERVGN